MENVNWYNRQIPNVGDIVMVKVVSVDEAGAKCLLLEYGCKEGFVPLSESIKKRGRGWVKLIRAGGLKEMQVLSVDTTKQQLDLSPKYVTPSEAAECLDRFEKGRRVHNLLKHLAEEQAESLQYLYDTFVRPLSGSAWTTFEELVNLPEEEKWERASALFGSDIRDSRIFASLLSLLSHQLVTKPVKVESQINLTCYANDGVIAIRAALQAGIAVSNEVHVHLVSAPTFSISAMTQDTKRTLKEIEKVIETIETSIVQSGGKCSILKDDVTV
eukprot:TRINITY_DN1884_c2_g3_i3.p1 TRINITY_DN1884_c2_g3~~TRINITY_DN1884_c2_g3_i3.p1  ORF type:complete len:272 (-),score=35.53 TRINITY_DN1884_c2_g3_i3:236-1051(-)